MMLCIHFVFLFRFDQFCFVLFSKSYKYIKRDRILAKVIEKQATITKTPDVSRVIQE